MLAQYQGALSSPSRDAGGNSIAGEGLAHGQAELVS
jgi:hypothetical protein